MRHDASSFWMSLDVQRWAKCRVAGPDRLLWGYDISAGGMFQAHVNRTELEIT